MANTSDVTLPPPVARAHRKNEQVQQITFTKEASSVRLTPESMPTARPERRQASISTSTAPRSDTSCASLQKLAAGMIATQKAICTKILDPIAREINISGPVIVAKRGAQNIKNLIPTEQLKGIWDRRNTDPTGLQEALQSAITKYVAAKHDPHATQEKINEAEQKANQAAKAYQASRNEKMDVLVAVMHKMAFISLAGTGSAFGLGRNGGRAVSRFFTAKILGTQADLGFFVPNKLPITDFYSAAEVMTEAAVKALMEYPFASVFCALGNMVGQHVVAPLINLINRQYEKLDSPLVVSSEIYSLMNEHDAGSGDKLRKEVKKRQENLFALGSEKNIFNGEVGYDIATGVRALSVGTRRLGAKGVISVGVTTSIGAGALIGGLMAANMATATIKVPDPKALREAIDLNIPLSELALRRAETAAEVRVQAEDQAKSQNISLDELGALKAAAGLPIEWEAEPVEHDMPLVYIKRMPKHQATNVTVKTLTPDVEAQREAMEKGISLEELAAQRKEAAETTGIPAEPVETETQVSTRQSRPRNMAKTAVMAVPHTIAKSKIRYTPLGHKPPTLAGTALTTAHNIANFAASLGGRSRHFARATFLDDVVFNVPIKTLVPLIKPAAEAVVKHGPRIAESLSHRWAEAKGVVASMAKTVAPHIKPVSQAAVRSAELVAKDVPTLCYTVAAITGIHFAVRYSFGSLFGRIPQEDQDMQDTQRRLQEEALPQHLNPGDVVLDSSETDESDTGSSSTAPNTGSQAHQTAHVAITVPSDDSSSTDSGNYDSATRYKIWEKNTPDLVQSAYHTVDPSQILHMSDNTRAALDTVINYEPKTGNR
jgi:hypothetical protein